MAETIANYRIGSASLTLGSSNLGFTDESTELEVGTEYADITVDKYAKTLVDQRIMGRSINVKAALKQSSASDITDVWNNLFANKKSGSSSNIVLADETNASMRAVAQTLTIHRRKDANGTITASVLEDFTLFKAAITEVGAIALNNEGETIIPITITGYIDETNGLFRFGNSV